MTPKEKALQLVNKYYDLLNPHFPEYVNVLFKDCKQCALIAVDEILNLNDIDMEYSFYVEVKQEIELL
jgi:hypothetical protein